MNTADTILVGTCLDCCLSTFRVTSTTTTIQKTQAATPHSSRAGTQSLAQTAHMESTEKNKLLLKTLRATDFTVEK